MLLEACVGSYEEAKIAEEKGADRIVQPLLMEQYI